MPKGGIVKTGDKINRIKEVLKKQGRTQTWLAEQTNKTRTSISSICNNLHHPHLADLKKIAIILDVDIRDLLYPTKHKKK